MNSSLKKLMSLSAATLMFAGVTTNALVPMVSAEEGAIEFPNEIEHEGEPIEGGTIHFALIGEGFAGVLNPLFFQTSDDGDIINFMYPAIFGYNEAFEINDKGLATVEWDLDNKQATVTIKPDLKWDDGEPLTIDDYIFAHEVLAHPDYQGPRLDEKVTNVAGFDEFNKGDADSISGLEKVDDQTVVITYQEMLPSYHLANGMLLSNLYPKHVWEDVPVDEMEDHELTRNQPVGFGAFKLESLTPGEAVTFSANEYYWKGKPKVDGLVAEVVNSSAIVQELKAGNYDLANGMPSDQYDAWADAENFDVIGKVANQYAFIGFKLGHWDEDLGDEGGVVMDEDKVLANKALRQAMAYALDRESVAEKFYNGLQHPATSFITPNFEGYYDEDSEGYEYNPEKAKEILAEAGFVDNDGDGYVEDPNGEPFTLYLGYASGSDIAAPLSEYYLSAWEEVGIDVELYNGRLVEFNSLMEDVDNDVEGLDMFAMALTTGGDPNPNSLWATEGQGAFNWNMERYQTDRMDELLGRLDSLDMLEDDARLEAYNEWNDYMMDELPEIPLFNNYYLRPVNKRVKYFTHYSDYDFDWSEIELTAEEPIAE